MHRVMCSARPCPITVKTTVFKAVATVLAPPGTELLAACAIHLSDNVKIARKSRRMLLHPRLVSQSAFFYMVDSGVDLSMTRVDHLHSYVASGVIEGILALLKLVLIVI
ncbi:hypothetical protein ATCVMN08101_713L [Acanthocystis turfacea Chlorella virus MN0810.1]|nr:hypothetical protein ATCVMN08101_713L [Acanthocystis turfacea Chlorella virus MN0810.1]